MSKLIRWLPAAFRPLSIGEKLARQKAAAWDEYLEALHGREIYKSRVHMLRKRLDRLEAMIDQINREESRREP